jgi:hypothetical protein
VWCTLKPAVGAHEFFAGLIRDYRFSTADNKDATWQALRNICRTRRGRRDSSGTSGPADSVDEQLLARVQRITFCRAYDGAEVAKGGIQLLRREGLLPNLRYQFRDRPHTTRTVIKSTFAMCPESEELRDKLISGEGSFAKRARHNRRFGEIWLRRQREDPTNLYNVRKS